MSDVERICLANNERRKWADEVTAQQEARAERKRVERARRRRLQGSTLICAVIMGVSLSFVAMGVAVMHPFTVIFSLAVAIFFGLFMWLLEEIGNG